RDLGARPGGRDDDMLLLEIARRALGGPVEEGRGSYQVAVSRCEVCTATGIDAGGESHVVGDEVAEMIACDSQEVGNVDEALASSDRPHVGGEAGLPTAGRP